MRLNQITLAPRTTYRAKYEMLMGGALPMRAETSVEFTTDDNGLPLSLSFEKGQDDLLRNIYRVIAVTNGATGEAIALPAEAARPLAGALFMAAGELEVHIQDLRMQPPSDLADPQMMAYWGYEIQQLENLSGKFQDGVIDAQDDKAWTLLTYCATKGWSELAKRLIALGADPNRRTKWGRTPLMYALERGDEAMAEALIAHGADVAIADTKYRMTAWHFLAQRGTSRLARCLLDKGADINAVEINGATLLHGAAFHGNRALVEFLLSRGASTALRDGTGNTAAAAARFKGRVDLANLIEQHTRTAAATT